MTALRTTARGVVATARRAGLVAGALAAAALAAANLLPLVSDLRPLAITGPSMTGSIAMGSMVFVRPVPTRRVRVGDVVSFDNPLHPGERVTHRVVAVEHVDGRPVLRTRGDHNPSADPWRLQDVDGTSWVVAGHVPVLGRLQLELQRPAARVAVVAMPVAFLTMTALWSLWRPARRGPAVEGV